MLRIAIILGSTRPGRKGEAVAKWVYEIAQKRSDADFQLKRMTTQSQLRTRVKMNCRFS